MKLRNLITIVIAAGLIMQGCGEKPVAQENEKGVAVETVIVSARQIDKIYSFSGTISSLKKSTLSTRIMGQIGEVLVKEGDNVDKGQLLVSIRSKDISARKSQVEANIIAAKAAYVNAEKDLERVTNLYETKSATKKELDDISTHYKMTKAQLEAAKKAKEQVEETLAYANIRAPYSGVITQRFVDAGDMANPGMPLIAIEAPGKFEVITRIPESEVNIIEKNDTVQVMLKNSDEVLSGTVSHISPSSRFSGSQYDARILLNPTSKQVKMIRSGMFANIMLPKGTVKKILVENNLIINRGQLTGIWTVGETGSALLRWVRLGKKYANQTEVLSGLSDGDKLIVKSDDRLFDGLPLNLN